MIIYIDGKKIFVDDPELNIVDIATQIDLVIPAPCYKEKRQYGCCNVCAIQINGKIRYACSTKPVDGMKIIFKNRLLKKIRADKISAYAEARKNNIVMEGT
jgi:NADH dehydrogenase/NADH:ubiquinone oxidoreductase subunit G